ncbi:hypothetical protein F383_33311 [Gossypium arboreum]|uniref:Uncharacterized protein n=1 Tax=Gossypium arboreum TaxID=29729 RepID=A0A0B0PT20_GOSAR|nr:hypothetical protein F383_33311 [Gossypium arboreum]
MISRSLTTALVIEPSLSLWGDLPGCCSNKEKLRMVSNGATHRIEQQGKAINSFACQRQARLQ